MQSSPFFDYPGLEQRGDDDFVFLSGWSRDDWERLLAHTETRRVESGETVVAIGETDRSLYIVTEGTFEVLVPAGRRGHPRRLATVETGSVIGELALFDGQPRSASVRALTSGELLRLSLESFETFAARHPELGRAILLDLGRLLALRLRRATALLARSGW